MSSIPFFEEALFLNEYNTGMAISPRNSILLITQVDYNFYLFCEHMFLLSVGDITLLLILSFLIIIFHEIWEIQKLCLATVFLT